MRKDIVIICAVNNDESLERDLKSSPMVRSGEIPAFFYRGARSAGEAYNAGIEATQEEYMIFVHQDVYLPRDWHLAVLRNIELLESRDASWGVLGCYGITAAGRGAGTVWSSGANREYRAEIRVPVEVRSLEEVLLVVRRSSNVVFDSELPSFHLYGTDVVLSAASAGYKSYAINAPIIHNSKQLYTLDHGYRSAFAYMCNKWSAELPVRTSICTLSRNKLSLLNMRFRLSKRRVLHRLQGRSPNRPLSNPSLKAQELGYEESAGAV